jgi:hypothetical protein
MSRIALPTALLLVLAASPAARAQEPGPAPELGLPTSDAEREIRELFEKVERRLREIDRLLSDASAGEVGALEELGSSGIDELLERSRREGREAVNDIDRILEIARQLGETMPSGAQQGGGSPGGQQGQSPLQGHGQSGGERERTPEAPPEDEPGQGGGETPTEGERPRDQGETPKSPGESRDPDPRNEAGAAPPSDAGTPGASVEGGVDRWGDLPVHVRDLFRAEGGGDLPPRYRDFIDSYHRRLARRP